MRLYLSSFRVGRDPSALLSLLHGRRRTALIVNADDYKTPEDRAASLFREVDELTAIGLAPTEVDLRRYFGAPSELSADLADFDLIYVRGGNVFLLRRALRQSGADGIITDLVANDRIVYAGYSAGSCVLASCLRGFESDIDDPTCTPPGYADIPPIWEGLDLLPFGILPHYDPDSPAPTEADDTMRWFVDHHLPFIALRDGEALVIKEDHREIAGRHH